MKIEILEIFRFEEEIKNFIVLIPIPTKMTYKYIFIQTVFPDENGSHFFMLKRIFKKSLILFSTLC